MYANFLLNKTEKPLTSDEADEKMKKIIEGRFFQMYRNPDFFPKKNLPNTNKPMTTDEADEKMKKIINSYNRLK